MVALPGTQEAAADQVVDLALVVVDRGFISERRRRNDGVVIADLRVVDEAAAERALPRSGRQQLAVRPLDVFDDARERCGDVLGEVAAVGARVADQLVPLVQRLREIQRPLRAEPK